MQGDRAPVFVRPRGHPQGGQPVEVKAVQRGQKSSQAAFVFP